MGRVMSWEEAKKMPVATAGLLLSTAKKFAEVFGVELTDDVIDDAAERMRVTYQFESATTIRDAKAMFHIEQNPGSVLFENSRTKFVTTNGTEFWQSIKQVGKDTTLGDFKAFIATLIEKHGADKEFYIESDHGDEYFILRTQTLER
jgi:hypothetical protein